MTRKVYAHLVDPGSYPIYHERYAKAVTRKVLGNEIQFTALRVLTIDENNRLKNIKYTMDVYVDQLKLGKVLWPVYTTLQAEDFKEFVDLAVEKGAYIFDIWGYVPGCRPEKDVIWGEYTPSEENLKYLKEKAGDHFLGFDNGEQDGRYAGGYSHQHLPLIFDRKVQYRNFHKHFRKLGDALANNMVTLASLTFLHYFAKEGNTIMLGAETAQALPNNNMWFSFIRGAARQYGLLYFGNASVWNRWGYKSYESQGKAPGYEWGPSSGTSLSLLRRLIYSQYMYNCDILGFDQSWILGDDTEKRMTGKDVRMDTDHSTCVLTPVGQIQRYAAEFVKKHGRPGVMHTPLGIAADFFSGWVPPRHLYTKDIYKVWGNLPYEKGDHQLDLIFEMLYPGYTDSGFYHDERGFLCPAPYGEIADVIFNDVPFEILRQYETILVTSGTSLTYEFYDKVKKFVLDGGNVIFFGSTIKNHYIDIFRYDRSCGEFFGLRSVGGPIGYNDAYVIQKNKSYLCKELELCSCVLHENATVIASLAGGEPVIIENKAFQGKVTVILSDHALITKDICINKKNEPDMELIRPYEISEYARDYLEEVFEKSSMIKPDNPQLQYSLCVKSEQEYTLLVANNTFEPQSYDLISSVSQICSVEEMPIEDDVKGAVGYFSEAMRTAYTRQKDSVYTIDCADVKLYDIKLAKKQIELKEPSIPKKKPGGLFLAKPEMMDSLEDVVLFYPEFIQHFSGILVSAGYLDRADADFCATEARYLMRQNVGLLVDLTGMLDLYPDLSLFLNLPDTHAETIRRVSGIIEKAALYNASGLILSLHRNAECNLSIPDAVSQMIDVLKIIMNIASLHSIQVYVQNRTSFISNETMARTIHNEIPEIKPVFNFSFGCCAGESQDIFADRRPAGYLLSSPFADGFGQMYAASLPVWDSIWAKEIKELYLEAKENRSEFTVLYANYKSLDDIYADIKYLTEGSDA